ncbi:murein L,D-transpeptidase catalytic domain family protein [Xanthomonas melonis]|uniref:Murein L,D-transpeptidase catalytic domain family protein n=1 Tax=Xanthomonas melonis TaxID=56456 RepID=A0ABS8NR97_9XANT|nr:murein L,D-transpeptidase catalytic domain family protein [Xanthomonas melonis]MCD0244927.1 murein L,D-transpeptidase catalytic domain family protein [Xanthomonas melonis]MCD0257364.1 murein L,D-transpeptidase catalytic domain family protein [Xanthomonas melonis]MCD0265584.1 murein L,D-transpeptidase catalytic domain family protein [Xanthomonas melonis]
MGFRVIAVATALCGWSAAGAAQAADAMAASPVVPLGAPRAGLIDALARQAPALDRKVLALATEALHCARQRQQVGDDHVLSVIDYSRPSTERRLWVFDLARQRLLFKEWVAHGRNTGENLAATFSNTDGSFQSSLGAFTAQESYTGQNGYSLRLKGLEPGFNDHARDRAIVIHGAPYVSEAIIRSQGRLGRSLGCPAVRPAVARQLIDTLRDGAFVFAYYPDRTWLRQSQLLHGGCGAAVAVAAAGGR